MMVNLLKIGQLGASSDALRESQVDEISYLDEIVWESFVKDAINACAATQLGRLHFAARALDVLVEILDESLHHPREVGQVARV